VCVGRFFNDGPIAKIERRTRILLLLLLLLLLSNDVVGNCPRTRTAREWISPPEIIDNVCPAERFHPLRREIVSFSLVHVPLKCTCARADDDDNHTADRALGGGVVRVRRPTSDPVTLNTSRDPETGAAVVYVPRGFASR